MDPSKYWLLQWLDDHKIRSAEEAERLLDGNREVTRFREQAEEWELHTNQPVDGTAVLAGRKRGKTGQTHLSFRLAKMHPSAYRQLPA